MTKLELVVRVIYRAGRNGRDIRVGRGKGEREREGGEGRYVNRMEGRVTRGGIVKSVFFSLSHLYYHLSSHRRLPIPHPYFNEGVVRFVAQFGGNTLAPCHRRTISQDLCKRKSLSHSSILKWRDDLRWHFSFII